MLEDKGSRKRRLQSNETQARECCRGWEQRPRRVHPGTASLPSPCALEEVGVGGAQLLTHLLPALAEPMEAGRCWREEAGGGDSVKG